MPANEAKDLLKNIREQSPNIKLTDRKYKENYSKAVWTLVEELLRENERLERQADTLENMVKVIVNQSQLAVNEMKQLRKAISNSTAQLKSLPTQEHAADDSEEVDLKGV